MINLTTRMVRLRTFFGSRTFFIIIMIWFGVECAWIALSALYPMAFDERYHFGLIKLYAQHGWPVWWQGQPHTADVYGALTRDPSYLYHYLMSFPYRLLELFTHDQTIQVIVLRFINIGLFASALLVFRRVLRRGGLGNAATSLAILVITLIPITPLLAAEINYDNLLMLLMAWVCLLTIRIIPALGRRAVPLRDIVILAIVCLFGSLVKYAFLPIFAAAALYVLGLALWQFRGRFRHFGQLAWRAWCDFSRPAKWLLGGLFILALLAFGERYGVNLVRYHQPIPNCAKVLSVPRCMAFAPWARNYTYSQNKSSSFTTHPVHFTIAWWQGMHHRLFFTINGDVPVERYNNAKPLPLPAYAGMILAFAAPVAIIVGWRWIRRDHALLALLAISLLYLAALFYTNYQSYQLAGGLVAINGRYLLPVLLPVMLVAGRGLQHILPQWRWPRALLATLAIVCLLQGGGVLEYIIQSDTHWYWPNPVVQRANLDAQSILRPLVVGGSTLIH